MWVAGPVFLTGQLTGMPLSARRQSAEWTGGAVVVNECVTLWNRRPCILIQVAALKEYLYMTLDTEGID